jgi:hypothetical protein
VWLPYARISTASASICSSVKPGLRLMIFNNYAFNPISMPNGLLQVSQKHTVLVIPSVNRMNSIRLSAPSQWGLMERTNLSAEACESALLYESGMCLRVPFVAAMASVNAEFRRRIRKRVCLESVRNKKSQRTVDGSIGY